MSSKLTPVRIAPSKLASVNLALEKVAPLSTAPQKFAPFEVCAAEIDFLHGAVLKST